MGNPFFFTFFYSQKVFKRLIENRYTDLFILNLLSNLIFNNGKWTNWKCSNTRICVILFDHFPKSKIDLKSRFERRKSIFLFYLSYRVPLDIKKKKMYFQNVIWPGQGIFFGRKFFWKSHTSQNMPKFWW